MKFIMPGCRTIGIAFSLATCASLARAETPEEWVKLGARIHGAFGAFIPIGIRIGLDAQDKLKADPRGLEVTYYSGQKSPCPCVADGIMIAALASPGQGTLQVASDKAPEGLMALAIIRDRKSHQAFKYTIADEWLPKILDWNRSYDPVGRYDAAMKAVDLFKVEPEAPR